MTNGCKFVCLQTQSSENSVIWESVLAQGLWNETSCLDSFFDRYNWNQDDQLMILLVFAWVTMSVFCEQGFEYNYR